MVRPKNLARYNTPTLLFRCKTYDKILVETASFVLLRFAPKVFHLFASPKIFGKALNPRLEEQHRRRVRKFLLQSKTNPNLLKILPKI